MREHDQDQDQQGHKREQGVVGDGPREQNALVGPKALEHGQRERAGALEHLGGPPTEVPHHQNRYEGSGQKAGAVSSDAAAEPRTPPHRIAPAGWEGNGRRVRATSSERRRAWLTERRPRLSEEPPRGERVSLGLRFAGGTW